LPSLGNTLAGCGFRTERGETARARPVRGYTPAPAGTWRTAALRIRSEFDRSGSGAVVVVQHSAQALAALHLTCVFEMASFRTDELVCQALMIALAVIMRNKVLNGCPQRLLTEEDQAVQTGFLDAAHKPLRVGVQIRRPRWEFHRLHSGAGNHRQEPGREQRVAIVNKVSFSSQDALLRIREIAGDLADP